MGQNIIKSGEWGTCLWGIDETGFLVIGEGTAKSIDEVNPAPWDDVKEKITSVSVNGRVSLLRGASLAGMFKDCINLTEVKLMGLDTSEVTDMASMFENCVSLSEVDLSGFNTYNTLNMSRMFSGCRNLTAADLTSFNTTRTSNMRNMFQRCTKLQGLCIGDGFSTDGNGNTDCGNLAIRDTGKYRMAKVLNYKGGTVTYYENRGRRSKIERETLSDFAYTIEDIVFDRPSEEYKFLGWNTECDGTGRMYIPGEELTSIDDDLDLYAIWVCPPKIGEVEPMPVFSYGQPLPFKVPEVISENDPSVYGYFEISPTGEEGTWKPIERNAILPVACNGYMLRLCATNKCGTSYSNIVPIKIKKAGVDLSMVRWTETQDMTYDGGVKEVWLEGLPEGVTAKYGDNRATEAGNYSASVELEYDNDNYSIPVRVKNHEWTIKKARFDMSEVAWDYTEAFVYDGTERCVSLTNVPENLNIVYSGNTAVDAGIRTATAVFEYDERNYEKPEMILPCIWEIEKQVIDARNLEWSDYSEYVFDGFVKSVAITNLPEDAQVEYTEVEETQAGKYLATARLTGNYYSNLPIEYEWEIKKARYDMSGVHWNYSAPFSYDREAHEVFLTGVPTGVSVQYQNHVKTDSGDYIARATFACLDPHNYATPEDKILTWSIKKLVADMRDVHWSYTEPFVYDGETKSVDLVGLPVGVYAVIENGSAANAGIYVAHANLKYDERNVIVEQPADCQWQINKAKFDISDVTWSYDESFVYDGTSKSIKLLNVPEGINVEYTDNAKIDSGKYVATAKLTPSDLVNYEVPEINGCAWSIKKSVLDRVDIQWSSDDEFVYDGKEKSVKIISDINDKIRVEYSGETAVNAGVHEAIATFYPTDVNNYEAPEAIHYKWTIRKGDFEFGMISWNYNSEFTYDGTAKTVKLDNLPKGVNVAYENNTATEAGEYTAIARFQIQDADNYNELEPVMLRWGIHKATFDMSEAEWQEDRHFTYDGNEKSVVIKGLPKGITPVYLNNRFTNAGDYLATVEFKYDEKNYEKPVFRECRWSVEKASFDISEVRWESQQTFIYDATAHSVGLINIPEGASVLYDNATATNAGIYYASAVIVPDNDDNYIATRVEDFTWRIVRGEYDMSEVYWDYNQPLKYDGTEQRILLRGLPEGVTPIYSGNQAVDSGEYTANATFAIADSYNYNIPTFKPCRWQINKADIDMSDVTWDYDDKVVYNGRMHEIALAGLPAGIKAVYRGNCETNVGIYHASADLVLYDNTNYNTPQVPDCNWEIVKADYDMSLVYWDYDTAKTFNTREQGVFLENLPNGVVVRYSGNEAVDAGKYTAKATLDVLDGLNFNTPSVADCEWEIIPADIDVSQTRWNYEADMFVYDGQDKQIELINVPREVEVRYNGNKAVGAGDYSATAEFVTKSSNYNTPELTTCNWSIEKADCDMSQVRWNYTSEFTYDGNLHCVEVEGLPANVTVNYENNKNIDAGVYEAIARFSTDAENYNIPESIRCEWTINKANADISDVRWDYSQNFVYDGTEKVVELAGVPRNMNVVYTGNTAVGAGSYEAHAEFVPMDPDNYNVPASLDTVWEIAKADYDLSRARWSMDNMFEYDGRAKSVVLEGYPQNITAIYSDNEAIDVGEYRATVRFEYDTENYNEPTYAGYAWSIKKSAYDLSRTYWDYNSSLVFNGGVQGVQLVNLPDGIRPIYENNTAIDAGEYFAEVRFAYDEHNYEHPSFRGCKWKIEKAEIPVRDEELVWTYTEPFTYTGNPQSVELAKASSRSHYYNSEGSLFGRLFSSNKAKEEPAPEELAPRLEGVPEGFEVVYSENEKTEVGIYYAKAVIKPIGNDNYNDHVVRDFKWEIRKANINLSNVRWDYEKSFVFDGTEKSVKLLGVPEQLKVTYLDNVATKAGKYEAYANFELVDEKNYNKPRTLGGCMWQIDKASYDMDDAQWVYNDDLVYDGKEQVVAVAGLPEGVEVEHYRGNKAVDAGTYTADVTFKYHDHENYNMPEIEPLRWRIHKKRIDTDNITWNYNDMARFVYDETVKEVTLLGVPDDVEVVYVNNSKAGAGTYAAKAKLVYDTRNYAADEIPDLVWTIEKANFDIGRVAWDYNKPFVYDGEPKKVSLKNLPTNIDVRYMDNKATEIGSYTAKAYLTYNRDNYNAPDIDTSIEWEILRDEQ
ncbi:MAG: BspA family leucine-rich repeat surface protein [Clostridiales bacterium]|nr:BspA family leucine-rich repeat surface protein [Candidatus Crickella equi]